MDWHRMSPVVKIDIPEKWPWEVEVKKIIVPDGMLFAAVEAVQDRSEFGVSFLDNKDKERIVAQTLDTLEAAIRWLSEHPIVPTTAQAQDVWDYCSRGSFMRQDVLAEWQRRMFLAPELKIPEIDATIPDLLFDAPTRVDINEANRHIREAYKRGRAAGKVNQLG